MDEETWYNERGKHRQQRGIQEFVLRTSTQAAVSMEKRGEDRREAAKSKQKVREKMSERMRRADEGKTASQINLGPAWKGSGENCQGEKC